ncbi:MAG: prephenate dehydratase domain-containing protein [Rikenellaceae bacterium]
MRRVAIQGIAGCFHEQAARDYFRDEQIEVVACKSFAKEFEALADDRELLGIIAIENTIAGALLQNHELLRRSDMRIVGEQKIRIELVAASLPEESIEDVVEINSHPIALMQCQSWLGRRPHIKVVEGDDTASSAQNISANRLHGHAAICGELAAELYGLKILERGIETNKRNFTRFLILAPEDKASEMVESSTINKSSIALTLPHTTGALSKVLTILSFYDLNMTKIQSMPIIGREWEYQFYIDVSFDDYQRYRQAIEAVRPLTNYMKILGEYASCAEASSRESKQIKY